MKDLQETEIFTKKIEEKEDERYETNDCIRYSRIRILLSGNAGCDEKRMSGQTVTSGDILYHGPRMIFAGIRTQKGNQNVK